MTSMKNVKQQLEDLRDALAAGDGSVGWLDREDPEEVAEVVQLAADVAATLANTVYNFMSGWDFAEDCRRGREKAEVGA